MLEQVVSEYDKLGVDPDGDPFVVQLFASDGDIPEWWSLLFSSKK